MATTKTCETCNGTGRAPVGGLVRSWGHPAVHHLMNAAERLHRRCDEGDAEAQEIQRLLTSGRLVPGFTWEMEVNGHANAFAYAEVSCPTCQDENTTYRILRAADRVVWAFLEGGDVPEDC